MQRTVAVAGRIFVCVPVSPHISASMKSCTCVTEACVTRRLVRDLQAILYARRGNLTKNRSPPGTAMVTFSCYRAIEISHSLYVGYRRLNSLSKVAGSFRLLAGAAKSFAAFRVLFRAHVTRDHCICPQL